MDENNPKGKTMLKLRYVVSVIVALAASQAFAQQATDSVSGSQGQKQRVENDPMKGCYAADQFYSEGMRLEVKSGTIVCAHTKSEYGTRSSALPFEWVKESDL
ncbi:hypothetical protein [Pseudomonas protegens]